MSSDCAVATVGFNGGSNNAKTDRLRAKSCRLNQYALDVGERCRGDDIPNKASHQPNLNVVATARDCKPHKHWCRK